ncbi:hypothetical protein L218DRAFT_703019 [Marasmius fiardii PR-910]|nr:hypothetical protein L218DRAFT_703019 [Marasmius fiardii PR-910]
MLQETNPDMDVVDSQSHLLNLFNHHIYYSNTHLSSKIKLYNLQLRCNSHLNNMLLIYHNNRMVIAHKGSLHLCLLWIFKCLHFHPYFHNHSCHSLHNLHNHHLSHLYHILLCYTLHHHSLHLHLHLPHHHTFLPILYHHHHHSSPLHYTHLHHHFLLYIFTVLI